ncbi:SPFH domain-containing protein [Pleurocapsa sp. PCC 7319]|uniref:SPFH domain-containing protein n=1 Tax=Pleurocapsa sp. PCC 7319 TaxID=118161 RepID=UPI00034798BA|nr:SPFH domain-containing protein [Pleurocapsa sp. PCC 7319]
MNQIREIQSWSLNGFFVLPAIALGFLYSGFSFLQSISFANNEIVKPFLFGIGVTIFLLAFALSTGLFIVQPNQAQVLILLGNYIGSVRKPGFYWTLPWIVERKKVSLRVRNFNSDYIKVNDAQGSPIEIGAVIVWRVVDSAKAVFDVEDFQKFVAIQSETAIRALANRYPYDIYEEDVISLRSNPDDMANALKIETQQRLEVAGVEVIDARLTHLAYAPEIAQAMLRRQQAAAVIAAKERIVEGAMGMVEMALIRLSEKQVVELDEERKAAMVNNLLVAIVSEGATQPIINTGTLYT